MAFGTLDGALNADGEVALITAHHALHMPPEMDRITRCATHLKGLVREASGNERSRKTSRFSSAVIRAKALPERSLWYLGM